MVTRGFVGRRIDPETAGRLPPGQHLTEDFPVLSASLSPEVDLSEWRFTLKHGSRPIASWNWAEFGRLPRTLWRGDIHCVTAWTKLGTAWEGVSIDNLLAAAGIEAPTPFVLAESYGGYSTNVPYTDLTGCKAMIATMYAGSPLSVPHGGPARLLVPHLYFWKSAKWCNTLKFTEKDEAGFWELRGYHMRGDPWKEQRYDGD